ncbi:putative nitronate monooxygenase [Diplonema papillatum]|nr:putative nitronate monooxygenase [Diplonema papillatum]
MADPYTFLHEDVTKPMKQVMRTKVTDLLRIRHPVLLAGMNNVASANLAAAVSNAGGLGSIGGVAMTPVMLRKEIAKLKAQLDDPTCFGIDLLLPQVGGNARKTNKDYTKGQLPELIDIIIENKARIFISAVGIPPRWAVEKLHAAGILVMNMCGHPKHVEKAIAVGADLVCCQGYEGGGHTGEIGTMALIPQCLEIVKGKKSELHGGPIHVIAAGGIYNGRGVAAALALGAEAVWVGTRFVASEEATAPKRHKDAVVSAGPTDTIRTIIYSGRPMRVVKSPYVMSWEDGKTQQIKELTSKGVIPIQWDIEQTEKAGGQWSVAKVFPFLVGQGSGGITDIKPALVIVNELVTEAATILTERSTLISKL